MTTVTASQIMVTYADGTAEVITYASADQADIRRAELLLWATIDARHADTRPHRVVIIDSVHVDQPANLAPAA